MLPALYAHPFSSYSQKVLVALYANGTPFEYRNLEDPAHQAALGTLWPIRRFPVLVEDARTVAEATAIIEYLHVRHPGPVRLLPDDPLAAVEVRMLDRFFDNYVSTPQQKVVFDALRAEDERDPRGVADARGMLDTAYAWLERHLEDGRPWAAGTSFSLADCAAAPFLFYADWTHPVPAACARVQAYRARLLGHPAFARAVEEARPFRGYFPLGAPDRD
ncbi:glutathione S-transferase family protein [Pseudoxanthomonas sp. 10H]|uniref:glutathione S-transferase family protein n=1 Tax=Pseudoxanthomonas sp. 10H TaxID=3242729 RepID=UPI003555ECE1